MNTKQLRQKILDLAIRGKLVPQDPNDEPASVLLERVRAEKEKLIKEGKIKRNKKDSTVFKSDDKSHYENVPFEVPESWVWVKIRDICEPQETKHPSGDTFRYIDIDAIDNKNHCVSDPKIVSTNQAPSRAAKGVCSGDTLFSMVRPYLENIAFISDSLSDCIASTGFYICRPNKEILFPRYLYYYLISDHAISGINAYMRGDNSPSIRKDEMDNFLVPVPPILEQKKISKILDDTLILVNYIELERKSLLETVTAAKQKILSLAIRGKLVPQDPNNEPASVLLDRIRTEREALIKTGKIKRGKSESAAIKSDDNSYYENLPNGWALARLDEVLDYEQPTQYIVESTDYNDEYDTPVLTAGKSFIIGYTKETIGICDELPVIIFDDFTTDSRYVDFNFKVKSSAMKILRTRCANLKYLFYFMQTIYCDHATHKRYWISDFSQKTIALPPLKEQEKIVEMIEQMYELLEKVIANLN